MLFEYETERLVLKVLKPNMAGQVLDFYFRDQELFERYEPERMAGFYTEETQKQILSFEYNCAVKGTLFRYYVYRKQVPNQIIGTISFHHIQQGVYSNCEIGYKFSSAVHHQGYATEALAEIVDLIFWDLKLHKVTAYVQPDNTDSIRLLERVGFFCEGICRDHLYMRDHWQDHARYSMITPYYSEY